MPRPARSSPSSTPAPGSPRPPSCGRRSTTSPCSATPTPGYASPANPCATELVQRAQAESEHHVRAATELVSRRANAARQEAERREREALALELRAEDEARRAAERRRVRRDRSERVLGRTVALLLQIQIEPGALAATVDRLEHSTIVAAVTDSADRLSMGDRPHAVALLRSMFDDAAAVLEVLTPPTARDTANYRTSRAAIERGLDALDAADGVGTVGHLAPEHVAVQLKAAEQAWRPLVAELGKALPAPLLGDVPVPRRPRHLTSSGDLTPGRRPARHRVGISAWRPPLLIPVVDLRGTAQPRGTAVPVRGRGLPRIVGRDAELRRVESFADDVGLGAHGRSLVLVGEAGIGKTTLWDQGVALCRETQAQVLVARPSRGGPRQPGAGPARPVRPPPRVHRPGGRPVRGGALPVAARPAARSGRPGSCRDRRGRPAVARRRHPAHPALRAAPARRRARLPAGHRPDVEPRGAGDARTRSGPRRRAARPGRAGAPEPAAHRDRSGSCAEPPGGLAGGRAGAREPVLRARARPRAPARDGLPAGRFASGRARSPGRRAAGGHAAPGPAPRARGPVTAPGPSRPRPGRGASTTPYGPPSTPTWWCSSTTSSCGSRTR